MRISDWSSDVCSSDLDALWVVGTDHAGIATQMVVERQMEARQDKRTNYTREQFVEKVWEWKAESGGAITRQLRRSEEHTSELQSLMRISYAVFCLKKKKKKHKKYSVKREHKMTRTNKQNISRKIQNTQY